MTAILPSRWRWSFGKPAASSAGSSPRRIILRTPSGVPTSDAKTGSESPDHREASRCWVSIRKSEGGILTTLYQGLTVHDRRQEARPQSGHSGVAPDGRRKFGTMRDAIVQVLEDAVQVVLDRGR